MLTNLTLLSVKKPQTNHDWKDTFSFGAGDISMLRSGFTVSSITSHPNTLCPRSFHEAMKGPFRGEWTAALFHHLDNCHSIGTFGAPGLPPHDATLLPAVLVLKHVVNSAKQINDRKVRLCVNGSYQIKGVDYTESFAPRILTMSINVMSS